MKGILLSMMGILLASGRFVWAEELAIRLHDLSPEKSSSFHGQLLVHVTNEGFTSVPLQEKIATSTLLVDGHPFKRTDSPFRGPEGLPIKGSWEGCMAIEDYVPQGLAPGSHHLQLQLGSVQSEAIHIRTTKVSPPAASPEEARRQVEILKDLITPGLLRSCVENWLTERDGGLSSLNATRYYVDPDVKVLVSYQSSVPEPRVKGRIRIYTESRISD